MKWFSCVRWGRNVQLGAFPEVDVGLSAASLMSFLWSAVSYTVTHFGIVVLFFFCIMIMAFTLFPLVYSLCI